MSGGRHALVGIEPDTYIVQVIALAQGQIIETLRDMRGLFVVVTSIDHAHQVWGKTVDLDEFMHQATRPTGSTSGSVHVSGSGTG